ncbi:MAG: polyphosphate polymerase domain-containing protein [Verrucomicrobia bacterium]|nr:polyphosphate polymerase domain-containing protein [Verrucomicrobiota bacterium]MBI3867865.1 polyphosphate polymerase domain-containing protein [Verrucomicrobiota bacterium]
MQDDRMQASRFELKYLITEDTALKVRDFVRSYLSLDEYGIGQPNFSYPVHSLYLDSNNLEIYWRTINGDKNRFKLRLRYYNTDPDTPVFFEIKRRMKDCILKQRGAVRQDAVSSLLLGHSPTVDQVVSKKPSNLVSLQRFGELMMGLEARPKVHIFYKREAYVSDDDQVRITLDRDVYAEPNPMFTIKTKVSKPVHSYRNIVILELKFTNRFPNWFRELVRIFNVMQCGAAKYVSSVNELGHRRLRAPEAVMEEPSLLRDVRPGDDLPISAQQDRGIFDFRE